MSLQGHWAAVGLSAASPRPESIRDCGLSATIPGASVRHKINTPKKETGETLNRKLRNEQNRINHGNEVSLAFLRFCSFLHFLLFLYAYISL